jgi:thiol:disulfide interchange protein DsbD
MRAGLQLFVFFSFLSTWASGQEKIQWSFDYVAFPSAIQISAKIENGWHLYTLDLDPSIGPVPTQIVLEKNKLVKELQPFEVSTIAKKSYDANFGAEVSFYERDFHAYKRIIVKKPTTVKGELTYMLCDNKRCLPPQTIPFEIKVKPSELQKPN